MFSLEQTRKTHVKARCKNQHVLHGLDGPTETSVDRRLERWLKSQINSAL